MDDRAFTPCVINSGLRADAIRNATQNVLFCAPGVTREELSALETAADCLPPGSVRILTDFSAQAFRAGYWGNLAPNELLQVSKWLLEKSDVANGLRLGLLVVDQCGWIYVPTPQSIEAEKEQGDEPNALRLNAETTQYLLDSILTPTGSPDQAKRPMITLEGIQQVQNELGTQYTSQPKIKRLLEELRPRMKILQFEVHGYKVTQQTVRLPREMIDIIGSSDQQINQRITADWSVFKDDANSALSFSQKQIEQSILGIKEKFLVRLGQYGFGLLQSKEAAFHEAWDVFQSQEVEAYRLAVREQVGDFVERSREQLYKLLKERAMQGKFKIPQQLTLFPFAKEEQIIRLLNDLLDRVPWPTSDSVADNIVIKYRAYDISESLLADEEFTYFIEKYFGPLNDWLDQVEKQEIRKTDASHMIFLN